MGSGFFGLVAPSAPPQSQFVTLQQRHSDQAPAICQQLTLVNKKARQRHPSRLSRSVRCWRQLTVDWINEPPDLTSAQDELLLLRVA